MTGRTSGLPIRYEDLTLGRFIASAAQRRGASPVLRSDGSPPISFEALHDHCRALARGWLALGLARGARVAMLLGNGPGFVTGWYACGMVGAIAVPLSTYATANEIEALLARSGAEILLTQQRLARRRFVDELALASLPALRHVVTVDDSGAGQDEKFLTLAGVIARGRAIPDSALDARIASIGPDDAATILFTSGSTGSPKAICHAHRAPVIQSWRWAELLDLRAGQRVWTSYPFFWSAGLAMAMGAPLAAGACLSLAPVFEPGAALDQIARESIEMLVVPAHVDVELAAEQRQRPRQLGALKRVRGGTQLLSAAGLAGDPADLHTGYGLTEMFTLATYAPRDASPEQANGTNGRLLSGQDIRILDAASGTELPAGQSGEIAVRGATLMLGYLDEPRERAFDAQGFHRPGDVGHFDAGGWFYWEGRGREMIRSRGVNVAPAEIEHALLEWGGIKFGRVVGLPHPTFGEAVVACGVRAASSAVGEAEVLASLRKRLAVYKLPQRVLFFAQSELDLTGTQKVRADALRRLAARRIVAENTDPAWTEHLRGIDESQREKAS